MQKSQFLRKVRQKYGKELCGAVIAGLSVQDSWSMEDGFT